MKVFLSFIGSCLIIFLIIMVTHTIMLLIVASALWKIFGYCVAAYIIYMIIKSICSRSTDLDPDPWSKE